jgi:hypothetical protein
MPQLATFERERAEDGQHRLPVGQFGACVDLMGPLILKTLSLVCANSANKY